MEYVKDRKFKHLTQEQVHDFMRYGFLRIKNCFSKEAAHEWSKHVWVRLGMDPNDPSTWTNERTNMPQHNVIKIQDIAPKAWDVMCELMGGEDRISKESRTWSDSFIVNLGTKEAAGSNVHPRDLKGWHVDGDFFVHFLDSPEQGLLTIPCWTDVLPNGGATWICDKGPKEISQYLYDHPEGVTPWMKSVNDAPFPPPEISHERRLDYYNDLISDKAACPDSSFHEMTGEVGDVVLLHPLMLHSASKNGRRIPRIITNPPLSLNAPFNLSRSNPADYSLVELKTIQDLGGEAKLREWSITGARAPLHPERVKVQTEMFEAENARLKALGLPEATQPETMSTFDGHRNENDDASTNPYWRDRLGRLRMDKDPEYAY